MTHSVESGPAPDHFVLPSTREESESFRPLVLDPARPDDAAALTELRDSGRPREIHERIEDQVEELLHCLAPHDPFAAGSPADAVADVLGDRPAAYGRWIWYPWSGRLVMMHAAGLRPEATLRQLFRTQGCWHDVTTYATVAPEWKSQATPRELAILDGAAHLDRV
ncbi:hypothetical protein ADK53_12140 [Streptomyces sp. WM6373]|uniref:hypothetical protein n=1 Tax=Streptomyces sp. WM6373 TaxID=1415556 RepID=UPI0006AE3414|nr:hypothetical protein [Streptomyces sp. WM6373]KOU38649.1 hypothetical protein ADK53_12140 [Streptomyces sp. WM6373]